MGAIEAIPTEYGGVVFRSKTEAVIARAFDLVSERTNGRLVCCWEYEPQWAKTSDGWVPDFFVMMACRDKKNNIVFRHLAELKPSSPTDAYMETLGRRFASIDVGVVEISKICVVGSPFTDEERYMSALEGDPLCWSERHPWQCVWLFDELVSAARKYRFDLKGAA